MDIVRRRRTLRFLSGNADDILGSLPDRDRAIVTEPFADKHHVHAGDVLRISPRRAHRAAHRRRNLLRLFQRSRHVLVDRSTLLKYLPDQPVTNIAVYVQPGAERRRKSGANSNPACAIIR